jgi:hypothetical protein
MPKYSHKELSYARPIADAILHRADFRRWLLADTAHANAADRARPIGETEQRKLRHLRADNPHWWFNYWCPKDRLCSCRIGSGIETDILIVLDAGSRRIALHVEVKRPGDHLGDGQAESYSRRAACWANPDSKPRTIPAYDDFLTVLVCGRELANEEGPRWFDKVVFHDDVARLIQNYPEPE